MAALAKFEFVGGLYYTKELGIILPAEALEATINGGARKFKEGPLAKAGMVVMEHARLDFKDAGPSLTPESLWKIEEYHFQRMVVISRARILRTRAIFNEWSAKITITYENTVCDKTQCLKWLKKSGEVVGLLDWRPRYGRFSVKAV